MLNTNEKAVFMAKMSGKWIELGEVLSTDHEATIREMIDLGLLKELKGTIRNYDESDEGEVVGEYTHYTVNVNFAYTTPHIAGEMTEYEMKEGDEVKLVNDGTFTFDKIHRIRVHRAINTGV